MGENPFTHGVSTPSAASPFLSVPSVSSVVSIPAFSKDIARQMMVVIAMEQDFSKLLHQTAERAGAVADEGDAHVYAFEEGLPEVGDGRLLCHVPEDALNICLARQAA